MQASTVCASTSPWCAGAGGGDRVGRLHDAGLDRVRLHVAVVRLDRVDDGLVLLVLAGEVHADGHVAALDLVVDGLAQVVEKTCALGDRNVGTQLGGDEPRDVGDLDGVLQHVLAVARAVFHAAEQLDDLGVETVDVRFEGGALTLLTDGVVDLLLGLGDHLLNAGGMDAAVLNELFERQSRHLAADRVKAGYGDGFGRIVDDQIAARERFDGADVAALAADDAALHLVVRQGNDRDGHFARVVGGAALDGRADDLARHALGVVLELALDLLDLGGLLVHDFVFETFDEVGDRFDLVLLRLYVGETLVEGVGLAVERVGLAVERFLLLLQTAFLLLQLAAAGLFFLFKLGAVAVDLLLGLHERLALLALGALDGVVDDALGLFLRAGDFRLGDFFTISNAQDEPDHERCDDSDHPNDGFRHGWCNSSILVRSLLHSERRVAPSGKCQIFQTKSPHSA